MVLLHCCNYESNSSVDSCSLWGRRVLHTSTAVGPWTLVGDDWDCTQGRWDCWALCMLQKAEQSQVRMERIKERLGWGTKQETSSRDKTEWIAERSECFFKEKSLVWWGEKSRSEKTNYELASEAGDLPLSQKEREQWVGTLCLLFSHDLFFLRGDGFRHCMQISSFSQRCYIWQCL